jgi:hypothetical protein
MRILDWRASAVLAVATITCPAATPGGGVSGLAAADRQLVPASMERTTVGGGARLAPADRARLADAPEGRRLRVLLASRVGLGEEVARLVRSAGGSVWRGDDRAGFVIADLTPDEIRQVEGSPLLTAIALDQRIRTRAAPPDSAEHRTVAAQTTTVASAPPYSPIGDIGAPQFITRHPSWDGRGVVIGVVDTGADPSAPGLQTTTTGQAKVIKSFNLTGEGHNVVTDRIVRADGGQISVDGQVFQAPSGLGDGEVRFGEMREGVLFLGDLNRDGDRTDVYPAVAAGSTREDLRIWFDTDLDDSFADETGVGDWNTTHDLVRLGHDNPDTTHVEEVASIGVNLCQESGTVPCTTTADRLGDVWDVILGTTHGTPVTSVAAGYDMHAFGQSFSGVAPGAQVINLDVDASGELAAVASRYAAALLLGAEQGADVLTCSCAIPFWRDAIGPATAMSQLVENLIAGYGVAVSVAAGNNRHIAASWDAPQTARNTISVGSMATPATFERNYLRAGISGEVVRGSTAGPIPDGAYHPDVLAPTDLLTSVMPWVSGHVTPTAIPVEQFPPGYRLVSGTSFATPVVGGALAVLISAARAEGVPYTPHTLKRALELSARPLHSTHPYQVVETGHGLIQMDKAWMWLQRLSTEGAVDRDVDTLVDNEFFGEGQGIYQRNHFTPTEQVTLTTGEDAEHTYQLKSSQPWIRLDRTEVRLPANGTATFTVHLNPQLPNRPGVHSGVVTVDDPSTRDPADHEMMVVIVTPTPLDPNNQLHVTGSGKTGIHAEVGGRVFVNVPPEATRIDLESTTPPNAAAGSALWGLPSPADEPVAGRDRAASG